MVKKKWLSAEIDRVRQLYEFGYEDDSIALYLGRTTGSVSNCRQAHGITRPQGALKRAPEWTSNELKTARSMYECGESRAAISLAVGRSEIAIKRLVTSQKLQRRDDFIPDLSTIGGKDEWRLCTESSKYAVSSSGEVVSLHPGRIGEIIAVWVDDDGYRHVHLCDGGTSKRYAIHRLVALAFLGQPPSPLHEVAHKNGVAGDDGATNLRWATKKENQADRLIHGTADRDSNGRFRPSGTADMIRRAEAAGVPVRRVE